MFKLVLRGRVAPNVLTRLPNLTRPFQEDTSVSYAFVLRQGYDISIGTTFRATEVGANGYEVTQRYRLMAVSHRFDVSLDRLPYGWDIICAFQLLGAGPDLLASLPFVAECYEQSTTELVLSSEA